MAKIINKEVIKHDTGEHSTSYRIDFGDGMLLWFDTWRDDDGEFTGDWNKYIFYTNDEQDMKEKAFQEACNYDGAYNFMTALELCEEYEATN